jgi:beta-phosphoglucomutase-like phosphatase (HAD superfamily)
MTPLYIFDLDGTTALVDHRRHILDDQNDSHRWQKFYAACEHDEPNRAVIETMAALHSAGAEVWVFSGRSDEVREQTLAWLERFAPFVDWDENSNLTMRAEHDHRPDDELKKEWLDNLLEDDRARLVAVFDDRDKVVAMWRANGVACFQVAPGDF